MAYHLWALHPPERVGEAVVMTGRRSGSSLSEDLALVVEGQEQGDVPHSSFIPLWGAFFRPETLFSFSE